MKTIILSFKFILLLSNLCFAQAPNPGENILHPNLDRFEGTWKWTSPTEELVIKLKKVNYYFLSPANYTEDILMGVHSYKVNGVTIEDFTSTFAAIGQNLKGTLFLSGKVDGSDPDNITGGVKDELKNKYNYLGLTYLNGTIPQLQWHINNFHGNPVRKPSEPPFDYTFTLPNDIILIKQ